MRKSKTHRLLGACLLAALLPACVLASDVSVHPRPQSVMMGQGQLDLSGGISLQKGKVQDPDALKLLGETLREAGVPTSGGVKLRIALKGDPVLGGAGTKVAGASGAYQLMVGNDGITIIGNDQRGLYYAVQTLSQLLDGNKLPKLKINDFPAMPFRGTVEGFYGKPWSHRDRLSQFAFYGKYKLNTYIYGPKDDPYHSSPHWRKPYPKDEAEQIRELAEVAKQYKVDFFWAIHPGKDIKWTEEDDQALLKKFDVMYDLGVRAFAVFFDDISGKGTDPKRQAAILNRIHKEFVLVKGDVRPLIMAPTQYNKGWSGGDYLDILGDELDPSIHIMWTGDTVVDDINRPAMEWINARLKRKAFAWWNFPVTDYVRDHLMLGAAYGIEPDAGDTLSGFTSNPMDKPEASKLALYGVADYCWNPGKYDAQQAWVDGIKALMPDAAEAAYAVFARHNADGGPSYHNYRRVESVAIAPVVEQFLADYAAGKPVGDGLKALAKEFRSIQQAPATIREHCGNPELVAEIDPWLTQFEELGNAGVAALQTAALLQRNEAASAWSSFAVAQKALDQMQVNDKTLNQNRWQPGVKTGSLVMTPFVEELVQLNGAALYSKASGRQTGPRKLFVSFSSDGGIEKMADGDDATFYESRDRQKVGDFAGIDLGSVQEIRKVSILQGRNNDDHDLINKGQLEASVDNKNWQPLGKETTGAEVEYAGQGVKGRYVRYRVVHAGKLDGSKNDVWTRIRRFEVNPQAGPKLKTNHPMLTKTPLQIDGGNMGLSPLFEVIKFKKGQFTGLDFGEVTEVGKVTLDLKVDGPETRGELQLSLDGTSWTKVNAKVDGSVLTATPNRKARYLRFVNNTGRDQEVYLNRFLAETKTQSNLTAGAFNDGDVTTAQPGPFEALKVRNEHAGADGLVLLLSGECKVKVVAYDAQGKAHNLGVATQPYQAFSFNGLKKPLKGVVLSGNGNLHEVVWHTSE